MLPRNHAAKNPDKPAYIMARTGEVVTWRDFDRRLNRCAQLYRTRGLKIGDHVAILMENNPRFFELTWAAQQSGLYYTPISTHLTMGEVEYIVNDCGAKLFVSSTGMGDLARELLGRTPNVQHRLMVNGTLPGYESYEENAKTMPATPIADEVEGQSMLYSSGTTGRPKGIVPPYLGRPIGEIHPVVTFIIGLYGFGESSVYLSPAPLYHAAPLGFSAATHRAGGTVIIMEKFDALDALSFIEKYKVTHSQWVPTMFIRMLKLPEADRKRFDLSTHKVAIHAAAPCPIPVKEQMIQWWGPIIYEYYGASEGNCFVALNSEEWLKHKGSVGRPFVGKAHILDEDAETELARGEAGTIYFSDGPIFEYLGDPSKTATSRNSKGWSTVGDIGYLDEDGYLYLTDRKANMIISGGVNIYPQEAENILVTHPKVADAAVFGVPNEEFGEEVKAVVQPAASAVPGPELERELIEFCQKSLAKIKCPKTVDFEQELPRTPTGKLFKRRLRDRYWSGTITGNPAAKKGA